MTTLVPYDRALPEVPGRTPFSRALTHLETMGLLQRSEQRRGPGVYYTLAGGVAETPQGTPQGMAETPQVTPQSVAELLRLVAEGKRLSRIEESGETPKHGMLEILFQIETDMEGNRRLRRYISEVQKDATQDLPESSLLRYAFKMATGSGKTVVRLQTLDPNTGY